MLSKIHIEKLFGIYNYDIELKDEISIIFGINGCGKTTILRMLKCIFKQEFKELCEIDFVSIVLFFDFNTKLIVEKKDTFEFLDQKKRKDVVIKHKAGRYFILLTLNNGKDEFVSPSLDVIKQYSLVDLGESFVINNRVWTKNYSLDDLGLSAELLNDKTFNEYYSKKINSKGIFEISKPIIDFLQKTKVQFIPADRLKIVETQKRSSSGSEETSTVARVSRCAKEISEKISTTMQNYGYFSQNNDRTFPFRVIRERARLSLDTIQEELIGLELRRKQYVDIGILDREEEIESVEKLIPAITEENVILLSQYVLDTKDKLNVLEKLSRQISLFKELLEKKLVSKQIVFNKRDGFYFIQNQTGKVLKGTQLSSGEQQELIMLYDMIFNTGEETLVLIDEPELSLHIKWQIEFIPDMFEIIKTNGFKAILATHSPEIISNRWDLTIPLTQ